MIKCCKDEDLTPVDLGSLGSAGAPPSTLQPVSHSSPFPSGSKRIAQRRPGSGPSPTTSCSRKLLRAALRASDPRVPFWEVRQGWLLASGWELI